MPTFGSQQVENTGFLQNSEWKIQTEKYSSWTCGNYAETYLYFIHSSHYTFFPTNLKLLWRKDLLYLFKVKDKGVLSVNVKSFSKRENTGLSQE